jgi:HD-GYP domain-containing protein (c-di-GMP phosphodiesterase class II)
MACLKVSKKLWNWKSGDKTEIKIGNAVIPMNYFSCGTYFFDGEFQVVKFPKGLQLYHGSAALANANVEFPAGLDYYNPHTLGTFSNVNSKKLTEKLIKNQNESVEYANSKFFKISAGWFADPKVAKTYSLQNKELANTCGEKCIAVYELTDDAIFIILDNNFNIWRILNDQSVPEKAKNELKFMFNLDKIEAAFDQQKFGEIDIKRKRRRSYRHIDLPFTEWLCSYITKDYAGYAANTAVEKGISYFHLEFTFCEPMKWLKRNLMNSIDWQFNTYEKAEKIIQQFIQQMSYYKSTNVDFHAGNLLEHSIWSLLFAEQLVVNSKYGSPSIDVQKKIATIAFIHDIGKMIVSETIQRKHDRIYYSIPNHPQIGGDYIRGKLELPLLDSTMNVIGNFDTRSLLKAFGLKNRDISFVSKIIDLHWEFGNYLNRWKNEFDEITINKFIDKVGRNEPFIFFFALIIVSIADILASQPFGVNNLTSELNHHSRFFPFIKNVPKKYRGGNLSDSQALIRNLFAEKILDTVLTSTPNTKNIMMEE